MSREPTHIQRGDSTNEDAKARYQRIIARAKKKGGQRGRPEDLTGTPRFDDVQQQAHEIRPAPGSDRPPPQALSDDTTRALQAAADATAEAQRAPSAPAEAEEVVLTPEDIEDIFDCDRLRALMILQTAYPDREGVGTEGAIRRAIEKRCSALNIGQFLMNGVMSQVVRIIPASGGNPGLTVKFTTIVDDVEVDLERRLADESTRIRKDRAGSLDVEMSRQEYERRTRELALAAYINEYQGKTWPSLRTQAGVLNGDSLDQRLALVRQLPAALFTLLTNNLSWFLDRVQKELNVAVLGNG